MTSAVAAQINILTNRYDGARVGANLSETILTPVNVTPARFGKLYSYPVEGSVYAQPLYVRGLVVNGTLRNVLFVATMNDKLYAFDADSSSPSPLWTRDFTSLPSVTPVPITDIVAANLNIVGNIGIQSTPVIDAASGTMYLVARTKENGAYVQRLHALDIATGLARPGSPVTIKASVAGSGGAVTFDPKMQGQRAALALSNGVVLIAWAGHEDVPPYHGWVMGYDSATLAQVAVFCVSPDTSAGGIWQGGRGPTIDAAGNAYFVTGNGAWDGTRNFGNSVLKFAVSRAGLTLLDYFTPGNQATLTADDDDLSGSSFTLIPGTNLLLGGGKEGVLYLLNAGNLGRIAANDTQIVQRIPVSGGHVMGGPVFWNSASLGPMIYNWSEDDVLKAYRLASGRLALPPFAQGNIASPGHPGGSLTLSANGATAGSGIIWASMPTNQDGIHGLVAGVLRAFDAETLNEIWSSERSPARDRVGTLMKFVPPIVVNGRVYLPSHDNAVAVYGLLPPTPPTPPSGAIAIDFVGSSPSVMGAEETAGVVAQAHWNSAAGASRTTPLALVDAAGAATGASVTWSAPGGIWMMPTTDQAGNARMMKGYLDTSSTSSTTVTVAGLASRAYDVYAYADGDNRVYDRAAAYTISGPGITTATIALTDAANVNFASAFTQAAGSAGNYVRFRINAGGFTLTAVPTTPQEGTRRAPLNGMQIVPVAPPADFTVAASPASRTVAAGGSVVYTVTVGALNGFSGQVALSVAGAPAGSTAAFSPSTIGSAGTSTLTVTIPATASAGTSTLTITGTSGSLRRSATVALTVAAAAARSGAIGIDFVGTSGISMGAAETAGVVPQSHWNSAIGATQSTPLALVDDSGAATAARVTWSAVAGWMLPIADQPGNARMMKGYLDTTSTSSTTVTVSGLAQGTYDVFVYGDGDNRVYDRAARYTIGGSGVTAAAIALTDPASTNFGSAFTEANGSSGNYVRFQITGAGFTLTAAPTTPEVGTRRAAVNGIQIVPVAPAPAAIGIDFTGAGVTMGASETAGVVDQAGWNAASGAARSTPLALMDERGAATNATATWSANGVWTLPIADQPGNARLMRGYLDTSSTSVTSVSVAGLAPGTYDIYVYADGDNGLFSRSASYRITGAGIADTTIALTDPADVNFTSGYTAASASAGNYVKFRITAGAFTLIATPTSASGTTLRAPVNAIQIVPVQNFHIP